MNEDLAGLFEKLNINKDSISPDVINNLVNIVNNSNSSNDNSNNNESSSENSSSSIDFETILKMKSVMDKLNNKEDPRANLLLSLKPYLKDSRKEKLDQYIQLLKISKVLDVFPFLGGENKNAGKQ